MPALTRRPAVAMVLTAALLAGSGCTGSGEDPGGSGSSSSPSSSPAPLPTEADLGVVTGRLPQPARDEVLAQVTQVVDGWLDAAYVGGDYPRSDFSAAFPGFTTGAAERAQGDLRLLSNADLGEAISGVVVSRRQLRVDVLATDREARAATARVRLKFRTEGETQRKVTVVGRLFLAPGPAGHWRIFGYDLTKAKA